MTELRPADAPPGNWVDSQAPHWARPYLRLARVDRPIGSWLLMWPCWWGLALANPPVNQWWLFIIFTLGAFVMRGAGCAYNDIVDRHIDAAVERTRNRPLPSGAVTVTAAGIFVVALLFVGFLLLLSLNVFAIWLGAASLLVVAVYPFMKRVTDWPQLVLGLAFNWGALLGWAAVEGSLAPPAFALYAAGICWTLGYDTIYAHQDKEDDALIGMRSTALKFGNATKAWLLLFYSGMIGFLALAGWLANLGLVFYVVGALAALHLAVQVIFVKLDDPESCLRTFRLNHGVGALVFAAIAAAHIVDHFAA